MILPRKMMSYTVASKDHVLLLSQKILSCCCLARCCPAVASQDVVLLLPQKITSCCCLKRFCPAVASKDFVLLLPRKMLSYCCLRKKNLERFRLCKTSNPTCTKNVMLRNIRLVEKNRLGPLAHVESSVS